MSNNVKIVVFVPESHADAVREAMGGAGAGEIGNYTNCSFSSKGTGRFLPREGANPTIGEVGKLEAVEEERIEMVCPREVLTNIVAAIRKVHPYEEVAFDIYPLEVE
ncbi:YqfO family protein [Patescibacteria group bacterium]|nr:YqfO family protein [Patescibacteria group bacterium]